MKVNSVGSAIDESFGFYKSVGGVNESSCRSHCAHSGTDAFIRHSGDDHDMHFLDRFVIGVAQLIR